MLGIRGGTGSAVSTADDGTLEPMPMIDASGDWSTSAEEPLLSKCSAFWEWIVQKIDRKGYVVRKGIKIEIDEVGDREAAEKDTTVRIRYDLFLSRGDVLQKAIELKVDLFRRQTIAGLRYGIEGIRVGGRRRFRASPHLAYGEGGVPEKIPSNAVLVFDVELLEVISYPEVDVEAV